MADISIRPLGSISEAETCAHLMATSEPWLTLGRNYGASLNILQDESRERYVAHKNGALAGFLVLNMRGAFVGYIQTVCVAAESRNRGIGTELIRFAEEHIFKEHPNVFMCVSSFNTSARELYERLGYRVVGELSDYIAPGHSEILLRKTRGSISTYHRGT